LPEPPEKNAPGGYAVVLNEREQGLLRRLAVFAGTFSLEAAEDVCSGDPLESEDILDGVAALVYIAARFYRRSQGVDLDAIHSEIPAE
jgi:hypothetical protein